MLGRSGYFPNSKDCISSRVSVIIMYGVSAIFNSIQVVILCVTACFFFLIIILYINTFDTSFLAAVRGEV